ncbi:flagellar hook-associated protein FlgK [Nocardioides sp. Kera G14]|uniref:flagellar hook-associated protein FlgK n=1 Tax=Nocardioides sp. Kera G14 TaxID=2884264 RepID=UPI001D10241C|nr:flagellar hook-associated protein FlgK [Nocardioides sp. Kera G14]UDY24088.1 flagellar hook-associated protein FlgK [Nocardioides sp. Kera G14]
MTGTFSGLNTALSGLRYQQIALDVANNNVSNVDTDGYVRRRAVAAEVGGTGQSTLYATYDGHGDGVTTSAVQRMTDGLLDARVRRENGTLSYLTTQQTILDRVETAINEPGVDGINQAISDFNSSLQDLVSDPGGMAARQTVVAKADALSAAIRTQSDNVTQEASDQRTNAGLTVTQINDGASQLADLNKKIYTAQSNGSDVGDLEDQRDTIALNLAKLVGGVVTVAPDGRYNVNVPVAGGASSFALVKGDTANQMSVQTDATTGDLSYTVTDRATPPTTLATVDSTQGNLSGQLGGITDVVNGTLADQKTALDAIATSLADQLNAQNAKGKDLYGALGGDLLSYDPADPAGTLAVAQTVVDDPNLIAASSTVTVDTSTTPPTYTTDGSADLDGGNADALSLTTSITSDYGSMVTSFGAKVSSLNSRVATQQTLTDQVEDEQQQQVGVNLDEETVNLVAAQHAYEAAAKVMSTLDSILDTLINMKN